MGQLAPDRSFSDHLPARGAPEGPGAAGKQKYHHRAVFFRGWRGPEGYTDKTVNEIVRAAYEMGKVKTGVLIVIERETPPFGDREDRIEVDGIVSSQLLINIWNIIHRCTTVR